MAYTKKQLEDRRTELLKEVSAIEKELEQIGDNTLKLQYKHKPFSKWSIGEWNQLLLLNPTAYDWFSKHKDATVDDYNASHYSAQKIILSD